MAKILLVDHDHELAQHVCKVLEFDHHQIETVHSGLDGKNRLKSSAYDLVLLEWQLPDMSGITILEELRSSTQAPVMMVTGKDTLSDKEIGFEAGADDYLTKPFAMRELTLRVKALLRRQRIFNKDLLEAGPFAMDVTKYRLTLHGVEIQLLPREFALMQFLMRHPNTLFSAEALLSRVWSSETEAASDTVRQTIRRIRLKLQALDAAELLETVRGVGYRLKI
jgi:DNA-binding response OmpR family regulator